MAWVLLATHMAEPDEASAWPGPGHSGHLDSKAVDRMFSLLFLRNKKNPNTKKPPLWVSGSPAVASRPMAWKEVLGEILPPRCHHSLIHDSQESKEKQPSGRSKDAVCTPTAVRLRPGRGGNPISCWTVRTSHEDTGLGEEPVRQTRVPSQKAPEAVQLAEAGVAARSQEGAVASSGSASVSIGKMKTANCAPPGSILFTLFFLPQAFSVYYFYFI